MVSAARHDRIRGAGRHGMLRRLFLPSAALATAAFATVLSGLTTPRSAQQGAEPPLVTVAKPIVRDIVEDDEFVGRFQAVDEVTVRSRVGGYLDQVHFQDGAIVKKGDLLFTIDQRPYQAAYDAAKSQVDVATSLLDFTKMQLDRAEELAKSGNIPVATVDDRRREYLAAQAQMQGAQADAAHGGAQSRIHRDQGAACRPHRPPLGFGRQPRPGRPDAAHRDRLARSDRLLFRHRRAALLRLCARRPRARRHACRKAAAGSTSPCRSPTASRRPSRASSISPRTASTMPPARCASARPSPIPTASFSPACSAASTCPARCRTRASCCPTTRSAPTRIAASCWWSTPKAWSRPSRCAPARASTAIASSARASTGDETVIVNGLVRARPGIKVKTEMITLPPKNETAELAQ